MRTTAGIALANRYELQIVSVFQAERAVSGPSAQRLRDLGLKDTRVLRALIESAVIRKAGPERYFLDEGVWAALRPVSGWQVWLGVAAVLLALVLGGLYLSAQ